MPAALGGTVTNRIPLVGLSAPKSRVPGVKKTWKITSNGTVPEVEVPGFAGRPDDSTATFRLAPTFTIKAKLIAEKKTYHSTMTCTVRKGDRVITEEAPIVGEYKTDTVDRHKGVRFNRSAKVQLVFFHAGPNPANTWTEPAHGTLTPDPTGLFTYTPDKGYAGPDSFTYTAKDDSDESTSTVTLKVKKAPSTLGYKAPRRIRFGEVARVRVKITSEGTRKGPITLTKGQRVLDKGTIFDGRAMLRIERKALKVGKHTLKIRYAGSATVRPATAKLTLRVLKRR
ncbi:MAG: Ig-like domain-containing protein [Nocardioidaceae bacterium]